MSIFKLLNLRRTASEEEIKQQYLRQLILLHPDRGGTSSQYLQLREAYERHVRGDAGENPYMVCSRREVASAVCRCGGRFAPEGERAGRIDCGSCSCFIEIQDDPHVLGDGAAT
jgi:hypothetical protein